MEELQEILLDSIARNDVSPVILNELEMLEERQIWRVTDTASEQRYTKACLLRFLGLLCHKFGVPLVRDRGSTTRINVSLDLGLLEAIDGLAKQRSQTRSAFIASAARRELLDS